eukprot:10438595-Alexandrium_andersonii.AAC.1
MSASLVGSEMCIRDRASGRPGEGQTTGAGRGGLGDAGTAGPGAGHPGPVSYTHLTLPTICSV